jgi:hypothetical protein
MNFKTFNEWDNRFNGTSLAGHVETTFAELVSVFGEPIDGDDKTDAEWLVEFEDGTLATIYNYKDGINYNGEDGTPVEYITDWHVGGKNGNSVKRVLEALRIGEVLQSVEDLKEARELVESHKANLKEAMEVLRREVKKAQKTYIDNMLDDMYEELNHDAR